MDRILMPLDGSELSERAVPLGVDLARTYSAELELIHVIDAPRNSFSSDSDRDRNAMKRYLQRIVEERATDVRAVVTVLHGDPVTTVLDLTRRDLETTIVMSTHGRGGLGRLMLGSVADKVLRGSSVPVALVRGSVPVPQRGIHTVLVPLDDSSLSEVALPFAADLASRTDATISLVRVCDPFRYAPSAYIVPEAMFALDPDISETEKRCISDARVYLDEIARERRKLGSRMTWEVRSGRPADEIIRAAETIQADLIVMSTHGHGGARRWAFGSVTNEVLHRGITPILAIPPGITDHEDKEVASLFSSM